VRAVSVVAWGLGFVVNAAALVGLRVAPVFQPDELPEPFARHTIVLFPWPLSSELSPVLVGRTESEVQAFFGDHFTLPEPISAVRCLEYYYPAGIVTVVLRHGRATTVWVSQEGASDDVCPEVRGQLHPLPPWE
jgi:hypothetical protein